MLFAHYSYPMQLNSDTTSVQGYSSFRSRAFTLLYLLLNEFMNTNSWRKNIVLPSPMRGTYSLK